MKILTVFAVMATLGTATLADETVQWTDLIDKSAQSFDDPYRDLSFEDVENLKTIVVSRKSLAKNDLTEEERAELESMDRKARLQFLERGIDADWLIDQRWVVAEQRANAATAGNPTMDGQVVVLTGYAIPAPPETDGTHIAYLVPERGMCSHMPPPNANQMVRVRLNDEWRPKIANEPVRLTGRISIAPTQEVFRIVDGPVQMSATFVMDVERAETLDDLKAQAKSASVNGWANTLAQNLRASGALPSTEKKAKE